MQLLESAKCGDDERAMFAVFGEACRILEQEKIPHVMGGGVAVRAYGRHRPLKDADIFLQRALVFAAMDALSKLGGFHTRDTDATWLYKAIKRDVLVDIIVRTTGDIHLSPEAISNAQRISIYGNEFNMMGPEDVLFRKIHSHCEGRPDLLDALSILACRERPFNWHYFVDLALTRDIGKVLLFLVRGCHELGPGAVPPWVLDTLQATGVGSLHTHRSA